MRRAWRPVLAVVVLAGLAAPFAAIAASSRLREYVYKELTYRMLAHRVTDSMNDPAKITVALNTFVDDALYPAGGPVLDTHSLNDLVRGIGWCDQDAWLLATLLAARDVPGRLVFLNSDSDGLAHTMAEVFIDGKWRLFDPLYGLVFRTPSGELATLEEVANTPKLVTDHPKLRALPDAAQRHAVGFLLGRIITAKTGPPHRWAPMTENKRSSRARALVQDALDAAWALGGSWGAARVQDLYLSLLPDTMDALDRNAQGSRPIPITVDEDPALFVYVRARHYHLYERVDRAERAYRELIAAYPSSPYAEYAAYFLGLLELRLRNDTRAGIGQLEAFLRRYPESAWLSRAQEALGDAYARAGDAAAAERHFASAGSDPYVNAAVRLASASEATPGR
jgi:TolA-binding protein